MKTVFILLTLIILSDLCIAQNLSQDDIDELRIVECSSVKIEGTHNHYVYIVQDTALKQTYSIKDTVSLPGLTHSQLKDFLNDTLINVEKKGTEVPIMTLDSDESVVGVKISDL